MPQSFTLTIRKRRLSVRSDWIKSIDKFFTAGIATQKDVHTIIRAAGGQTGGKERCGVNEKESEI